MIESPAREKMECQICATKKSKKAFASCTFCKQTACKGCLMKYLETSRQEPQCMFCKEPWTLEELHKQLSKKWLHSPTGFVKCRKQAIISREKAKIPTTLAHTLPLIRKRLQERAKKLPPPNPDKLRLERKVDQARLRLHRAELRLQIHCAKSEEERAQWQGMYDQLSIKKIESIPDIALSEIVYILAVTQEQEEQAEYILLCACPADNCRGLVYAHEDAAHCKACELEVCQHCLCARKEEHECKKEDVEYVELLRKDTKPCPKCGVQITKVSGCDQMWCTYCKTPFSWTSGEILRRAILHNPHAMDFRRANECPGDQGHYDPHEVKRLYTAASKELRGQDLRPDHRTTPSTKAEKKAFGVPLIREEDYPTAHLSFADCIVTILEKLEQLAEVEELQLRTCDAQLDALRIFYCMSYVTEESWADSVYTADQARARCAFLTDLVRTLRDGLTSEFLYLMGTPEKAVESLTRVVQLIHFVNDQCLHFCEVLGVPVNPLISTELDICPESFRPFEHYKNALSRRGALRLNHNEWMRAAVEAGQDAAGDVVGNFLARGLVRGVTERLLNGDFMEMMGQAFAEFAPEIEEQVPDADRAD